MTKSEAGAKLIELVYNQLQVDRDQSHRTLQRRCAGANMALRKRNEFRKLLRQHDDAAIQVGERANTTDEADAHVKAACAQRH
ncbi:hypothetical protein KOR42_02930 [Thalassoglobus neptunius]|uniref:Uncharacterized protein n=1 Tax=Thalassoglobus neptunius TaxID=1938619 RepID=A0A5C5X1P0_9PLAN|nr:hypothetical protein KOR42_02930 [Thalassoglobus neptunius]